MNFSRKWIVSFGMLAALSPVTSFARGAEIVEIPVEAAFAPAQGFDDNDNIQIVLHGWLPNACYTVGDYKIETDSTAKTMKIHQFAMRKTDAMCAEETSMPEHLKMAIPFTTEISLGQLSAGDYKFGYQEPSGDFGFRDINVGVSPVPSIDAMPYAAVTNAVIPDVVSALDDLVVTVSGVLNSSCTELDDKVEFRKLKDVFIVLPVIKVKPGVLCAQVIRPFEKTLNLGKTAPGHYLIHVRSMAGKAVNRVIEVWR